MNKNYYIPYKECIKSGWVSSSGKYVENFEEMIVKYTGAKYAIACINGTSALQLSLRLVGVKQETKLSYPR